MWSAPARADGQSPSNEVESPADEAVHRVDARREPPPLEQVRYLEDYSQLASPDARIDDFDAIKYIPLWPGAYATIGGQHRLRYEYTAPSEIGAPLAESRESVLLSRNLLHLDLHFGRRTRVFAQAGAYYALGAPERDDPPGANLLDVAQLFVETGAAVAGVDVTVRVGRQEMPLGSTRWVSLRDGANMHQAFDVARLVLAGRGWVSHSFAGLVPEAERGVFDDEPNTRNAFWGSYWTLQAPPHTDVPSFDLFYLGRSRDAAYGELSGHEVRHTFGVRVFSSPASDLEYIFHALVQLGTLGPARVLAWGTSGAVWYRLPGVLRPLRVGVRSDALSGDGAAGDDRVGTFDPLFPNQSYFGALSLIAPANLYQVHPMVKVEIQPVTLEAGCLVYFRQSGADAVYQPGGGTLIAPEVTGARYTATVPRVALGYRANRHLAWNAEYARVIAGDAMRAAGGRDGDFLGTWTTFTY